MTRNDGRNNDDLRPISIERDFTAYAPGSVLVSFGNTKVLCTASLDERVPGWLKNSGKGWVTAEYSLLPGSTLTRSQREAAKGKQSGRTQEIQRLIGRSLRSIIDLQGLPECQIVLDCDVLQADGGTRTAAITGSYVALHDAIERMKQNKIINRNPISEACAAISIGVVEDSVCLDLNYEEDVKAEVDMNVVMTSAGKFVEVQGTAEGITFSKSELDEMLDVASKGIERILEMQQHVLDQELPFRKIEGKL